MSQVITFKCPCCGGYLEFDPGTQRFKCLYCGQQLSEAELREQSEQRQEEAEAAQVAPEAQAASETPAASGNTEQLKTYNCKMCGAEVVTTDTTAATRCFYCHSPIVLHDRLDDEFRPDGVIPFALDKKAAEKAFLDHIGKKTFIDRSFYDQAQLEMFSGVYHPYWYCDIEGNASFTGEGTRTSITSTPTHIVTTTRYFKVDREGKLSFRNLSRKALTKTDSKLAEGVHPYDVTKIEPYASGYLSGFLAEKRDVDEEPAVSEMLNEASSMAGSMMKQGHTFNSLSGSTSFTPTKKDAKYVLLPTWVLTYKGKKGTEPYYYMMNGQTGRVCGRLPVNMKKLLSVAIGAGAAVMAILLVGGKFIW